MRGPHKSAPPWRGRVFYGIGVKSVVTIKDIANMANVSRGTVDRVLNNRGGVSPQTAERVRLIAEKLNYTPSITGRGLAMMKKDIKFGFILISALGDNPTLHRALERKAQKFLNYGVTVLSRTYQEGNAQSLLQAMDELEAEGVSGLAINPVACREVEEKVNALNARGVAVITYDHDLPSSHRLAFVGCHYYRNGRTIAGVIRLIMGGQGSVGVVSGALAAAVHSQRLYGLEDRLAEDCPNVCIVSRAVCDEDDVSAYAAVKKILQENPELDLLVLNAVSPRGAMRAIREWPGHVHIVSTNRIAEMEPYLEDHTVDAMVTHRPWVQTDLSMDILFQYLVWGQKPSHATFFVNDEIILPENMHFRHAAL